jgi:hypothetical protein
MQSRRRYTDERALLSQGSTVKRFFEYIFITIFFLLLIEGALPQVQMAIFAGNVIIPNVALKVLLMGLIFLGLCIRLCCSGSILWHRPIFTAYFFFVIYLGVHLLVKSDEFPFDYLLLSYNSYYFFFLLLPFAVYLPARTRIVNRWLVLLSLPLLVLGFSQYVSNAPLVPLASPDESFKVYSVDYYGQTRAFSLFNSGLNYGHFLSLLGAFTAYYLVRGKKTNRIRAFVFLLILTAACYSTLTRNLYLEFGFTLLTALLLARRSGAGDRDFRPLPRYLPVFYAVVAVVFVYGVQLLLATRGGAAKLLGQESLYQRYVQWQYYFPLWADSGLKNLLFGVGLIQNERFPVTEDVLIDNTFLAIGVHIGLIGLVLWLVLMWKLWNYLLQIQALIPGNPFVLAIVALSSTWMSSGLYSINFGMYALLSFIAISLYMHENRVGTRPCGVAGASCSEPAVTAGG